jgi:hypothetical protein
MKRLAIVAALISALAAAAPAAAKKPACTKLHQRQRLTIDVSFHYLHTRSMVNSQQQLIQKTLADVDHRIGRLVVGGAACLKPGKGWKVVDPIGVGFSSVGLSSDGDIHSDGLTKGWGIGIRGGQGGSSPHMRVQVMHCGQDVFWKSVKALNSVPIPGLSFVFDVARWVAGMFLPDDKVRCANLGVMRLDVRAGRGGRLRVRERTHDSPTEYRIVQGSDGWTDRRQFTILHPQVHRVS